jgi:hypothetical protein
LWLTAKVLHCAGRCEMAEAECYRPADLSHCGPEPRLGLDCAPGDRL